MGPNEVVVCEKARYQGRVRIWNVLSGALEFAVRPVEPFQKVVVFLFVDAGVADVYTVENMYRPPILGTRSEIYV